MKVKIPESYDGETEYFTKGKIYESIEDEDDGWLLIIKDEKGYRHNIICENDDGVTCAYLKNISTWEIVK